MPEIFLTFAKRVSVHLLHAGEDAADDGWNDVQDPDSNREPRENPEGESRLLAGLKGGGHDEHLAGLDR